MDFLEEYDEMRHIDPKVVVAYKFLGLFKVVMSNENGEKGLHWSTYAVDKKLSDDVLLAFKNYLKAKRADLKRADTSIHYGKMVWFLYQKILEMGAFDIPVRNEIRSYLDLCEYIIL